jgi:peptide/nickel transport system substrate-binding protein
MFDEWVRGDYIKVQQNPDYWGDQSNIEEIVFRTTTEASMRIAMLTTGEADLITNIPPQMIDQVEQAGALVKPVRSPRRVFVEFNRFDPLLQDVRLRQALAYSVDVDAIIDSVFSGGAYKAKGVLRPGYVGYDENNVTGYDYNPEKAKELMTEAGYPDGFETDLYVGVGRLTLDKELAEALVGQWQKAGIKVNLHAMEWGTYVTERFTQEMPAMGIISHAPMWWDGDYMWQNHHWSEGTWQYAHTPRGDEMFFAQRRESDPVKRAELEQELEKYWIDEEAASIILYDQQDVYGTSERFQWEPRQDELILFQEATLVE